MNSTTAQIIVCTHGDLACSLRRTVELIAGEQPGLICFPVMPGDDLGLVKARLLEATVSGRPTLAFVDMVGGTPWNLVSEIATQRASIRVVSGVNLPMLLEIALSRDGMEFDELVRLALETGKDSIQTQPGP